MSVSRDFLVSLLLCLPGAAVALAQPVGPEFRVNTYTTGGQGGSDVMSDASGDFVVFWQGSGQGDDSGVFGQRYDNNGNPLGGEFRVNTYTTGFQNAANAASDASGNFVVVWGSVGQDGDGYGMFGQRYDNAGNPLGGPFQVNSSTIGDQFLGSVASDASGNFVVVWTSYAQDGDLGAVIGQRYDADGNRLGGEFQVNTYTTNRQTAYPDSVASDGSGNFVVIWRSVGQDGRSSGIFGRRYDNSGNPLGREFQVNTYTTSSQYQPSVASDTSGNFVVVWTSFKQNEEVGGNIFGQRYDASGNAQGTEFQVNTFTTGYQRYGHVASDAKGNFVVIWADLAGGDGGNSGVFGQRYDSEGRPVNAQFQVNTYTTGSQTSPNVASDANGEFVVAWTSSYQDGSSYGVFGQRFSAACEASVAVRGDVHTPGSKLPVAIHIAHNRPETVTVPWKLSLIDPDGRVVAERVTPEHTFEPGDVVDVKLALRLPEDLEGGTYTLRLGISGMAGIEAATTSFQVVAE